MTESARVTLLERRADELRLAIARAALDLFVTDGETTATVQRICDAAGVAPRTFHRHFAVKEDVVLPLFRRSSASIADALRRYAEEQDPLDALVAAFAASLDESRLTARQRTFLGLMMTDPQYRMRWIQVDGELREAVAEVAARIAPDADTFTLDLLAELAAHAARRVFELWLTDEADDHPAVLLRRAFTLVFAGARHPAAAG